MSYPIFGLIIGVVTVLLFAVAMSHPETGDFTKDLAFPLAPYPRSPHQNHRAATNPFQCTECTCRDSKARSAGAPDRFVVIVRVRVASDE